MGYDIAVAMRWCNRSRTLQYVQQGFRLMVPFSEKHSCYVEEVEGAIRVSLGIGILAPPRSETRFRAVFSHLSSWVYRRASFLLSKGGEVVVYTERDPASSDLPEEVIAELLVIEDECRECFERLAGGRSPREALGLEETGLPQEVLDRLWDSIQRVVGNKNQRGEGDGQG